MDSSNDNFESAKFDGLEDKEMKKTPETVDTFQSIKNDEFEEEEYRKETRRRLIVIAVSSLILVLIIIGATLGVLLPKHYKDSSPSTSLDQKSSIEKICAKTLYPNTCYSSIYSQKMSSSNNHPSQDPDTLDEIFQLSLQVTINELIRLQSVIKTILFTQNDTITQNAMYICDHLMQDAIDHVNMSISLSQLNQIQKLSIYGASDIRTWLSTAITDQETCLDGLNEFSSISGRIQETMKEAMKNATEYTSNSLAIVSSISTNTLQAFKIPIHRKTLEIGWINQRMEDAEEVILRPNVTVAKDGSGDYRSITKAVRDAPKRSEERFLICVKAGVYEENVFVDSDTWNLMIYGDGMKQSIVSGSLNMADGVATFHTATFTAEGKAFIAKDMGFINKAGPSKHQAVALRSSSDQSIFHRCFFDGYQDTLYTHTNRQFYRDCTITGTIDFIFGNSAVVFQNCSIQPRQPGPKQYNTITAQGKTDPNQNTGISIQHSVISPYGNLTAQTFLGRPWGNYSTTVITGTEIEGIIDPAGWIPWDSDYESLNTLFYAEYKNIGPGSNTNGRVNWIGYKPNMTQMEAQRFSVEPFIQGSQWLAKANVDYDLQI